jgi:hypothetical protein
MKRMGCDSAFCLFVICLVFSPVLKMEALLSSKHRQTSTRLHAATSEDSSLLVQNIVMDYK